MPKRFTESYMNTKRSMTESKVSMKLLIDTQSNRVLFAEASKDCVDFLFHILSLPLTTAGIENLNESYIQPGQNKDILLKPIPPPRAAASVPLLLLNDSRTEKKYYRCSQNSATGCRCRSYFSDDRSAFCPSCKRNINFQMTYVAPPTPSDGHASSTEGGFVKPVVTYMVMDDLVVKPMSTISSFTLLNKFSVKDVSALQEKEVIIGSTEAVMLVKTCLHSKNVLTEVFLNKIKIEEEPEMHARESGSDKDSKPWNANRRRPSRSRSLGRSTVSQLHAEKVAVGSKWFKYFTIISKRRCLRRQSAASSRIQQHED